jgi:hypothetical protein
MNIFKNIFICVLISICDCAIAIDDRADIDPSDIVKAGNEFAWKITTSQYRYSESGLSYDFNMRANSDKNTFWIGSYRDQNDFVQTRIGGENSFDFSYGRFISSLQIATQGFIGGSVTWDGRQKDQDGLKPMVGFGRTNLKPYYNINFDPNDSILVGVSYIDKNIGQLNFFQIYDDRLGTHQKLTHLVWRKSFADAQRLTIDLFTKRGSIYIGAPSLTGNGVSTTIDIEDYFIRVARETKANYTDETLIRVSVGYRF